MAGNERLVAFGCAEGAGRARFREDSAGAPFRKFLSKPPNPEIFPEKFTCNLKPKDDLTLKNSRIHFYFSGDFAGFSNGTELAANLLPQNAKGLVMPATRRRKYDEGRGWRRERSWREVNEESPSLGRRASSRVRGSRYKEGYETPRSRRRYEAEEDNYESRSHRRPSRRGFASMDPKRQREIASEGGRAPHRSPRGFAAMDEEEQRQIASEGGRAPRRGPRGFAAIAPDVQRKIASRGGHASRGRHERKYEVKKGYEPSSSRRGASRRGLPPGPRKNRVIAPRGRRSRWNHSVRQE